MNALRTKRDILLMSYFRKNARENLTRISRFTKIPVSTIFDKLRDFEEGLIRKHTSIVDFRQLGFDVKANVLFKVAKETREDFRQFLMIHENVNSLFRINNGFDFMIEGIFRDMADLQKFYEDIDQFNILTKQELFILEDLKRESFLSEDSHAKMLLR